MKLLFPFLLLLSLSVVGQKDTVQGIIITYANDSIPGYWIVDKKDNPNLCKGCGIWGAIHGHYGDNGKVVVDKYLNFSPGLVYDSRFKAIIPNTIELFYIPKFTNHEICRYYHQWCVYNGVVSVSLLNYGCIEIDGDTSDAIDILHNFERHYSQAGIKDRRLEILRLVIDAVRQKRSCIVIDKKPLKGF
jgi:hypothetical protein